MSMRLLSIETRRNTGRWVFPIVALISARMVYTSLHTSDVLIWATSSKLVRDSLFALGPCVAGIAAWAAGREAHRALGDLLTTTPRPELQRRVVAWSATVLWGLLAYLTVGAMVIVDAAFQRAWGTPSLWPMLSGALAVLAHASVGYACGAALPGRFTAPLVAIGLFTVQTFVADQLGWAWGQWLSPIARLQTSVWYGIHPNLGVAQTLFLLGLVGLAWSTVVLGSGKWRSGGMLLVGAALLTASGVAETYRRSVVDERSYQSKPGQAKQPPIFPYTPVCSSDRLPVCVHPAYQSQLPTVAALINRMAEPLIGVPGAPTAAEQRPLPAQPDVLTFDLHNRIGRLTTYSLALKLVRDDQAASHDPGAAQTALQIWLMERAGVAITCIDEASPQGEFVTFVYERRLCDAARRFAALDPAAQRGWLTKQYANLRADTLRLEDLP